MNKLLAILMTADCMLLSAAVPQRWTVESSSVQPVQFDVVRGEKLALEATFNTYGKPLEMPSQCSLLWQTNGMGSYYWAAPATVSSNRISAVWLPEMDVGAKVYNCFLGATGDIYRACFQLRFCEGPGAIPNTLPLPQPVIDFSRVTVLNPPWPESIDPSVLESKADVTYVDEQLGYRDSTIGSIEQTVFNHSSDIERVRQSAQAASDAIYSINQQLGPLRDDARNAYIYSSSIYQYMIGNTNAWFSGTNYVLGTEAANRTHYAPEAGMDFSTVPCAMALWEIRDGVKQPVWDQRDWVVWYHNFKARQYDAKLEAATNALNAYVEQLRTNKMDRGWAKYTAVNGLGNPVRDTLWVDTPKIALAAGYQWETTVEISGYWVLAHNGLHIAAPTDTQGDAQYIKISDFEGNAVVTIRKSATRIEGAVAGSIQGVPGGFQVTYATDTQPRAEVAVTLAESEFYAEDDPSCPYTVTWSGEPGHFVATAIAKPGINATSGFMRAVHEVPGQTIVDNAAPVGFKDYLLFNGTKIRPKVSGSTVTWEVVP